MELSPQSVSSTTFKIVKKGYDPEQVSAYLSALGSSIEATQNQAAAMEARARAAVAWLQEVTAQAAASQAASQAAPAPASVTPTADADTISRTLLLAQRTADATVAEAAAEAGRLTSAAEDRANELVDGAQQIVTRLHDEAKSEARRAGDAERVQVEGEVQSLLARRAFLLGDVEQLEQHIVTQRERVREVSALLGDIVSRVSGGLGHVDRPLLSAVGDDHSDDAADSTTTADNDAADNDAADNDAADNDAADNDADQPHASTAEQSQPLPTLELQHKDGLVPMIRRPAEVMPLADAVVDPIWLSKASDARVAPASLLDDLDAITEELPVVRPQPINESSSAATPWNERIVE